MASVYYRCKDKLEITGIEMSEKFIQNAQSFYKLLYAVISSDAVFILTI